MKCCSYASSLSRNVYLNSLKKMIADIHIGNNLYGALAYNQEKIDARLGKILETNRVFVPADGHFL